MGTLASLVIGLTVVTDGVVSGLEKANRSFEKFQHGIAGKLLTAHAAVHILTEGLNATAEALEKASRGEEGFGQAIQNSATSFLKGIPIAGDFARMAIVARDEWLGDAAALRTVNAELEETTAKLAQMKAAFDRSVAIRDVLRKLGDDIKYFGMSAQEAAVRAAHGTEIAIAKVQAGVRTLDALKKSAEADSKVGDFAKSLEEQIANFGKTDRQAQISGLQKDGDPDDIKNLQKLDAALTQLEETKKRHDDLMAQGKNVFDSTRTPLEKYEEQITKLDLLLKEHIIDWDTYGRAVRQAHAALDKFTSIPDRKSPLERRFVGGISSTPASAIAGATSGTRDHTDNIDKSTKDTAAQAKTHTTLQRQMVSSLQTIEGRLQFGTVSF